MEFLIRAFREDGSQILGTMCGQNVLTDVKQYKRTIYYKNLIAGKYRLKFKDSVPVFMYKIFRTNGSYNEDNYQLLEKIYF